VPFDEDKGSWATAAAISNVTGTAAATYGLPEQAILNDTVARLNAVLAALRDAGIIALD
jgi:hypothetical protein